VYFNKKGAWIKLAPLFEIPGYVPGDPKATAI